MWIWWRRHTYERHCCPSDWMVTLVSLELLAWCFPTGLCFLESGTGLGLNTCPLTWSRRRQSFAHLVPPAKTRRGGHWGRSPLKIRHGLVLRRILLELFFFFVTVTLNFNKMKQKNNRYMHIVMLKKIVASIYEKKKSPILQLRSLKHYFLIFVS